MQPRIVYPGAKCNPFFIYTHRPPRAQYLCHHLYCSSYIPFRPRLDVTQLSSDVHRYYQLGLAPLTHKSYQAALQQYFSFCQQISHSPIPTSESMLLLYLAHMGRRNLFLSTIKVYVSAIRNSHVATGKHTHFSSQLTPRVQLVLTGIQRDQASTLEPQARFPITIDVMRQLQTLFSGKPHNYHYIMLWAACCTAFFGLLRRGEFTTQGPYNPQVHLSFKDLAVDNKSSPTYIRLCIKQSKTDRFRHGNFVYLGKTDSEICPMQAILQYLSARGAPCSCPNIRNHSPEQCLARHCQIYVS